ncbi:MAG TPA: peptidyl-prolyl cis-trans isomerase [Thermoanaerobaculia bacterium]|nr:peptidyl-prolyl cis-trans isomerase [Thermoanaerobaculia bacterium]HQR66497.1 peptidyl-prolyl cis-trans isomerase [Thermoanaerobaculia bacterium]
MLTTLRQNFHNLKWILWAVIAVFVLFVFVDWGMGSAGRGGDPTWAARMGSTTIPVAEFQREYRDAEDRYRQLYGKNFSPELLKMMNLPDQVLNGLIDRRILREEADRLKLQVTDAELTAKILGFKDGQGRPLFVRDGVFVGEAAYKRMLASIGRTPEAFEAETRDQVLLEKLNRFYTDSVFIGDADVEEDFASRNVKARIEYVLLPPPPAVPGGVTEAEAEASFKANPGAYLQGEKRKAKYLLVDSSKIRAGIQVSDADIQKEYNANAETYRKGEEVKARHILYRADAATDAAARAKAEAAVKKLKAGADFATLARAESDDPGSKANGGELPAFGRGQMVKEFEDAAFAAAPGQIVGPVKSAFGWHVILVEEKTPPRVQPLFEVAPAIRARLQETRAAEEARRQARDLSDRIAKIGKPSDDDLRKLATGAVTFNETEFLSRSDAAAGIGPNPEFSAVLFALKPGEVSPPVATSRGEVLVKLVEVRKPGIPPFAEVKARVIADLTRKKQEEAAVLTLKQALAKNGSLEAAAKDLKLTVEKPEAFGKAGPVPGLGGQKAVLDAAFAANAGETAGPIGLGERGAVALRVLEKTPFDKAAFEAQKERLRDSLRNQKASRLMQALLQQQRAERKIEINREVLRRFDARG